MTYYDKLITIKSRTLGGILVSIPHFIKFSMLWSGGRNGNAFFVEWLISKSLHSAIAKIDINDENQALNNEYFTKSM